jgi:pyruvate dehydrogenase E1 component beta subunit
MKAKTQILDFASAVGEAIREEMKRDESVVAWGEDLVSIKRSFAKVGLPDEFPDRVKDTPIVEQAILGSAMGAALTGSRPVIDLNVAGFLATCFEGLFMEVGGLRQEFGYTGPMPMVIYANSGVGGGTGAHHCASIEALLMHSPGLKVVMPSTPYDAKGLMKTAIRDDGPVVFTVPGGVYSGSGDTAGKPIPPEEYLIPFGQAEVKREGKDITIVAYCGMIPKALAAAEALSKEGIDVEIVDLRTLVPMDVQSIVTSVKKTGRLLIAHEAMKRAGAAGEIAFRVSEAAPDVVAAMKSPIKRLAAKNVPLPRSSELEAQLVPQVDDVVKAVKDVIEAQR